MNSIKNKYLLEIPIENLLKEETLPFPVYLKISEIKTVKLTNENDNASSILKKYLMKGIKSVHIHKDDYVQFISSKNVKYSDLLRKSFNCANEAFNMLNFKNALLEKVEKECQQSIIAIENSISIFKLFKIFQSSCSSIFHNYILTNYATSSIIDTFSWKSNYVKEKVSFASLLCDINLDSSDLDGIKRHHNNQQDLSLKALSHPYEVGKYLKQAKDFIPTETILIVQQHHEQPDSSGFPSGLNSININPLSSIHIVARDFIDQMADHNYDHTQKEEVLKNISTKYDQGQYRNASTALGSISS